MALALAGAWGCTPPPDLGLRDAARADARVDIAALPRDAGVAPDTSTIDAAQRSGVGGACKTAEDCNDGLRCDADVVGGICTRSCQRDDECGDRQRLGCADGRCVERCSVRTIVETCRDGQVCRLQGAAPLCAPDCRRGGGCPGTPGLICDSNTGLCLDPAGGHFGQGCGVGIGGCDATPNGVCLNVGLLIGSFCSIPCAPFTKPCPFALSSAACVLGDKGDSYCGVTCDPDAPNCPTGMSCAHYANDLDICLPD